MHNSDYRIVGPLNPQSPREILPTVYVEAETQKELGLVSTVRIGRREQIFRNLFPVDLGLLGIGQPHPLPVTPGASVRAMS